MVTKMIQLTQTEFNCAIKYGEIDNTDLAEEFISEVDNKCGIKIMLCYFHQAENAVLECYVRCLNNMDINDVVSLDAKEEIIKIFYNLMKKHGIELSSQFSLRLLNFDFQGADILLNNSSMIIKRFIKVNYNSDVKIFISFLEKGKATANQHIVFISQKDMDSFLSQGGIEKLKERFDEYLASKDKWNIFNNYEYAPLLHLSSYLNEFQATELARNGF